MRITIEIRLPDHWLNAKNTTTGGVEWNFISTGNEEGTGKLLIRASNTSATHSMEPGDTSTLLWNGTDWRELNHPDN